MGVISAIVMRNVYRTSLGEQSGKRCGYLSEYAAMPDIDVGHVKQERHVDKTVVGQPVVRRRHHF